MGQNSSPKEIEEVKESAPVVSEPVKKEMSEQEYEAKITSGFTKLDRVDNEKLTYKCLTCDKRCSKLSNIRDHVRTHLGIRLYECDICGKGFAWVGNLKRHVLEVCSRKNATKKP